LFSGQLEDGFSAIDRRVLVVAEDFVGGVVEVLVVGLALLEELRVVFEDEREGRPVALDLR